MYKKYFSKCRMNSILQVEYFSGSDLIRVSLQFDIEVAIITENSVQFKLAYSSPFLQPLLLQKFRLCGDIPEAQQLIHTLASIDSADLPEILSLFHKNNDIEIPLAITPLDWLEYQKQAKEATASSISGMHFGYYKIYILYYRIASAKYRLVNIVVRNRLHLKRWTRSGISNIGKISQKCKCLKSQSNLVTRSRLQYAI